MKPFYLLLATGVSLVSATSAHAQAYNWILNPANGNRYTLTSGLATWEQAEAEAAGLGGHLVTIRSQAEQDWLVNQITGGQAVWIGLNDKTVEGRWQWTSGEPVSHLNWGGLEPNNRNNEDCVELTLIGTWNDNNCALTQRAVVELRSCHPRITTHPQSQSACTGDPASFQVAVHGCQLRYQWRKDGSDIPGATGSSYSIPSASSLDEGAYDVIVTDTAGSVTSSPAVLSVADTVPYGSGLRGTACIPFISISCPKIGTTSNIDITRGLGGTVGFVYVGMQPIALPFAGGTLLVTPDIPLFVVLGGTGNQACVGTGTIQVPIPLETTLIDLHLFCQGVFVDVGAVQNLSLTAGVEVVVG